MVNTKQAVMLRNGEITGIWYRSTPSQGHSVSESSHTLQSFQKLSGMAYASGAPAEARSAGLGSAGVTSYAQEEDPIPDWVVLPSSGAAPTYGPAVAVQPEGYAPGLPHQPSLDFPCATSCSEMSLWQYPASVDLPRHEALPWLLSQRDMPQVYPRRPSLQIFLLSHPALSLGADI